MKHTQTPAFCLLSLLAFASSSQFENNRLDSFGSSLILEDEDVLDGAEIWRPQSRIINGIYARAGQFPYQVFIFGESNKLICSGAIVNEGTILTSASCGRSIIAERAKIGAGNVKTTLDTPSVIRKVSRKIVRGDAGKCDLAVLKLESNFELDGNTISSVDLQTMSVGVDTKCTISGWGATEAGGLYTDTLMYNSVPITDREDCSAKFGDGHMCSQTAEGRKDACWMDEGGPLVCNGLLSGIITQNYKCGEGNQTTIYADVLYCKPWILEQINNGVKINRQNLYNFLIMFVCCNYVLLVVNI